MNYATKIKTAIASALCVMVGMAFAYTETSDVQIYGATFESSPYGTVENDYAYVNGDSITNYAATGENPSGWFAGSDEDQTVVTNRGASVEGFGEQYLLLNTDAAILTNQLSSANASAVNTAISGAAIPAGGEYADAGIAIYESAVFESDVKFVASDTLDPGIPGGTDATKFAIYAYCDEENSPNVTNIVVFHRYACDPENLEFDFTNEIFNVAIDTTDYTHLRVEMKKVEDPQAPGDFYDVFSVTVNGTTLHSATASEVPFAEPFGTVNDGIWFFTTEKLSDNTAHDVASLNFKGTGEIENLKVSTRVTETYEAIVDEIKYADWDDAIAAALNTANVVTSYEAGNLSLAADDYVSITNVQPASVETAANYIIATNIVDGVYTYTSVLGIVDYTIIFVSQDGTVTNDSQIISEGQTPVYAGPASGTNSYVDATGFYDFDDWDPPIAVVSRDAVYRATFTKTADVLASVNGEYYATLQAALDAVKTADATEATIELLANASIEISKDGNVLGGNSTTNITINGNGNTLNVVRNGTWAQFNTANNAKLVLNNVSLTSEFTGTQTGWVGEPLQNPNHNIAFNCDVELNNVTSANALSFWKDAALDTVTIAETVDVYSIWVHTTASNIAIKDLVINSPTGRGIKVDDSYVKYAGTPSASTTISVNGAAFTTKDRKSAILVRSNFPIAVTTAGTIDISGVPADTTHLVWVDEAASANFGLVTLDGAQADLVPEPITGGYAATLSTNGTWISGYYQDLASAVADADADDTLTLLKDISETFTVTKDLTITRDTYSAANVTAGTGYVCNTTPEAYVFFSGAVVSYGGTYYTSLQAALDAVKTADATEATIELLADASIEISKTGNILGGNSTTNITINGNGNTLNVVRNGTWAQFNTANNAKLVLNGVDLTSEFTGTQTGWVGDSLQNPNHNIAFNCDVELNNVESDTALSFWKDAALDTVTIEETVDVYSIWVHTTASNVSIKDLVVNTSTGRGIKVDDSFVAGWGGTPSASTTISVNGAAFTTKNKKSAILVRSAYPIAVTTAGTIDISGVPADTTHLVWVDEDASTNFGLVTLDGAQADLVPEPITGGYAATLSTNGTWIAGYYKTLEPAVAVADADDTLTLLKDVDETFTVSKELTITRDTYSADSVTAGTGYVCNATAEAYVFFSGAVVSYGGTYYTSLQAALDAVAAANATEATIDLLDDASIEISKNGNVLGGNSTTNITINGNGNTLNVVRNGTWAQFNTANNNAKLVLNNVSLTSEFTGTQTGWVGDTLQNPNHNIAFNCDVELNSVTSTTAISFWKDAALDTVTIAETVDVYSIWIHTTASSVSIKDLVVNTSTGRGIKVDDSFVAGWGGTPSASTTISVDGATFTTKDKKSAILVRSAYPIAVTTAGTINIANVPADTEHLVWVDEDASTNFGLVTLNGAQAGLVPEPITGGYAATLSTNGTWIAGYYKTLAAAVAVADADDTLTLQKNVTETFEVAKALTITRNGFSADNVTAGTGYVCNTTAEAYVFFTGAKATVISVAGGVATTNYYATLTAAIAAAGNGDTVVLLDDVNEAVVNNNANSFTIDLNGNTWSADSDVLATTDGTITIEATNGGTMTTEAAQCCAVWAKGGDVVINGGTFTSKDNEEATIYVSDADSVITINGGTFENTDPRPYRWKASLQALTLNVKNDLVGQHLIINGGTFIGNDPQLGDDTAGGTSAQSSVPFVSDNYVAIDDGNGVFVVQPGHIVTFDANGGDPTPAEQRIAQGGTVTEPSPAPTNSTDTLEWQLGGAAYDFATVVTSNFTLVAAWTPASTGYDYPDGTEIADADQIAWIESKNFTQEQITALGSNDKFNECYLLNCDITVANAGGIISITSIAVGDTIDVAVTLTRTGAEEGDPINGTLKLLGAASLTSGFTEVGTYTFTNGDFDDSNVATTSFTDATKKFFKAVIE